MLKITGLDELQKNLKEAENILSEINDELGVVNFDPNDPASIETAIQLVNQMVDKYIGDYSANPILGPLADRMKESYREGLLQKAAMARLKTKED